MLANRVETPGSRPALGPGQTLTPQEEAERARGVKVKAKGKAKAKEPKEPEKAP